MGRPILLPHADTSQPQVAYELLAAWARLWRVSSTELSAVYGAEIQRQRAPGSGLLSDYLNQLAHSAKERRMRGRLPQLVDSAFQVPKPLGWIQELFEYRDASDAGLEPESAAAWAVDLIADLDDVELLLWVSESYAKGHPRLQSIQRPMCLARRALRENTELFLPASVWIQAVVQAFEEELPDESLRATLTKFGWLVQELVQFERTGGLGPAPAVPPELTKRLVQEVEASRARLLIVTLRQSLAAIRAARSEHALAAEPAAEAQALEIAKWRWVSPDRKYLARFELPVVATPAELGDRIVVKVKKISEFITGVGPIEGKTASELAGTRLRLAGVEATLDQNACASFLLDLLLRMLEVLPEHEAVELELCRDDAWESWQREP